MCIRDRLSLWSGKWTIFWLLLRELQVFVVLGDDFVEAGGGGAFNFLFNFPLNFNLTFALLSHYLWLCTPCFTICHLQTRYLSQDGFWNKTRFIGWITLQWVQNLDREKHQPSFGMWWETINPSQGCHLDTIFGLGQRVPGSSWFCTKHHFCEYSCS